MPMDDILLDSEERMEKAIEVFEHSLRGIRSGRASRALVETVRVDYYGALTPLQQLANIGIPEPQLIVIRPFDPSSIGAIEKAILKSDIGITPSNDGKLVRLAVPPLSEERRKQLASQVRKMGEETKVSLRNIRRDGNKQADREQADSLLSEDDAHKTKDEIQDLIKQYEKKVDEHVAGKSDEIMTI